MRRMMLLMLLPATLLGCGQGQSPSSGSDRPAPRTLTVQQALAAAPSEARVAVDGYVLAHPDGTVRLCAGLSGSYPPQCGRPALTVVGLDLASLEGSDHASGVTWARTTLSGVVRGTVLTVAPR